MTSAARSGSCHRAAMFSFPADNHRYDDYPYDAPRPTEERLRHLVFLDGRLIDSWTSEVEGTRYLEVADRLDREQRLGRYRPEPAPLRHEQVLSWLDDVVGGRLALLALDDAPLPPGPVHQEAHPVDRHLRRVAEEAFDEEFLLACRAVFHALQSAETDEVAGVPPVELAAGICWVVGRANGLVGAGTRVNQGTLKRVLGMTASPGKRVPRIKTALLGLWPHPGHRPVDCPDLLELRSPAYLTAATRRRLIGLRDQALRVAEELESDRHAREALNSGRAASLRP